MTSDKHHNARPFGDVFIFIVLALMLALFWL